MTDFENVSISSDWTYSTTMSELAENVSSELTNLSYDQTTENSTIDYTEQTQTVTVAKIVDLVRNVTKGINDTAINATQTTKPPCSTTTTEEPFDEFGPPEGVEYIFVPLGVMVFVIILSAVVLIISRKRKLERLRHRLMPLYNFDPGEEGEDDWETELLDENVDSRQKRATNRWTQKKMQNCSVPVEQGLVI